MDFELFEKEQARWMGTLSKGGRIYGVSTP